jgi:hypothetical protein
MGENIMMSDKAETSGGTADKVAVGRDVGDLRQAARTQSGAPSSTFWAFHDFSASGRFLQHIPVENPAVIVNSVSQIAVSITELDSSGRPFIGDAAMEVFNVAPNDDNTLIVRGHVHWDRALQVRLNLVILN